MARVLLVEPNEQLRRVFRRRLAREGFELDEAIDGEAALGAAYRGRPDLIVVEASVRDAGGQVLPLRLAEDPLLRTVPLIVLESRDDEGPDAIVARARSVGATAVAEETVPVAADVERAEQALDGGARFQELHHPFRPGQLVELAWGVLAGGDLEGEPSA